MLAVRSNRDEFSLIIPYVRFARETTQHEPLVIDTNIIIDGRIADLCATGFLSRSLIVPRFVLGELQQLADSSDGIKRERGRRGLDILNQLQSSREIDLTIHDSGLDEGDLPIDARLVRVAQVLQARLLTNDQALGQVARLQQVPVLNLNDLSRALRPVVVPGDELELNLVKEGRDPHQAVGYLLGRDHDRGQPGATSHRASRDGGCFERAANRRRSSYLCRAKGKCACSNRAPGPLDLLPPRNAGLMLLPGAGLGFAAQNRYRPTALRTRAITLSAIAFAVSAPLASTSSI